MIKDSGTRREFESGAVRDIQEGKGRCDLLPLVVVSDYIEDSSSLCAIGRFQETGDIRHLYAALEFSDFFPSCYTAILEVAIHFEEGAKKYGECNWQKGIPVRCYIDSAIRHYLKHRRGDKDEPHNRAFYWNILAAIWTCQNKPEFNNYNGADTPVTAEALVTTEAPVVTEKHIKSEKLCPTCAYYHSNCPAFNGERTCNNCPLRCDGECYCVLIDNGEPCEHYEKSLH